MGWKGLRNLSTRQPDMNDRQLLVRMSITSTVIFAFYLALVYVALQIGLGLPVIVGGLVAFVAIQYVVGTRGVLRQVGARKLPRDKFGAFYEEYEATAEEMGFEDPPRLMIAPMGVPNAFAVGRKGNGIVVVSATLVDALDFDEAVAVTAHELAHLKNRDAILMVVGESISTIIGLFVMLVFAVSDNVVVTAVGWILGVFAKASVMVFVLALSRYREHVADRDAASVLGSGDPLARALRKIDTVASGSDTTLQTNVSALCIYSGDRGLLDVLFSTHPSVDERVERLESL